MGTSNGLGDDIKKITKFTKMDKLAEAVAKYLGKHDCGCNNRADELNKRFPYR